LILSFQVYLKIHPNLPLQRKEQEKGKFRKASELKRFGDEMFFEK